MNSVQIFNNAEFGEKKVGDIMDKFELLSDAVSLAYDDKFKEAWMKVHEADKMALSEDGIYNNLRDAVCTAITALKKNKVGRGANHE